MRYTSDLRKWRDECNLANVVISDVRPKDISNYLQVLANRGLTTCSAQNVLTSIKNLYDFAALEHDYPYSNPASCVKVPINAAPMHKRKPASKEDIANIINAVDQPFGLFAYLLLYSGLRRGEALALKWEDCFDGYIHVRHHIIFDLHGAPVDTPLAKTAAGVRSVPIFDPLKPYISHPKSKKGYIFSRDGQPLRETWYGTAWREYRIKNHVTCTPHQLRHAFCTACYEAGVDAKVCAAWMGHANISTTLDVYTALSEEKEKHNSEKIVKFYKAVDDSGAD